MTLKLNLSHTRELRLRLRVEAALRDAGIILTSAVDRAVTDLLFAAATPEDETQHVYEPAEEKPQPNDQALPVPSEPEPEPTEKDETRLVA